MRLRHPYTLDEDAPDPDGRVHYGRRRSAAVDDDGTFELPDRLARSFVESWPTAEDYDFEDLVVDEEGAGDTGGGGLPWDPNDHTVGEVREHVGSIDGETLDGLAATLRAYREAEADGKGRKTALEAIESRLDGLEDP